MISVLIKGNSAVMSKGIESLLTSLPGIGPGLTFLHAGNESDDLPQKKVDIIILVIASHASLGRRLLPDVGSILDTPEQKHIVFYHESRFSIALRFLVQGAKGFVSQQSDPGELAQCFGEVLKNKSFYCQRSTQMLLRLYLSVVVPLDHDQLRFLLTAREREVMHLLLEAHSAKQVAIELGIHISTVSCLKKSALQKLGMDDFTQLLMLLKTFNDLRV